MDPVWSLYNVGTGCILGRAPRTKETLPDFHLILSLGKRGLNGVVSGYPTSTNIPRVDWLSTGPPGMGCHRVCVHGVGYSPFLVNVW